jgi:hypothetical protein
MESAARAASRRRAIEGRCITPLFSAGLSGFPPHPCHFCDNIEIPITDVDTDMKLRNHLLILAGIALPLLAGCMLPTATETPQTVDNPWPPVNTRPFSQDLPEDFYLGTMAQHGTTVYAIGGYGSGGGASRGVRAFDLTTGIWSEMAPMRYARCNAGVVVLGDYIYVLGGRGASTVDAVRKRFERYDIAADRWETLPDITIGDYDGIDPGQFVALGGKIYSVNTRRMGTDYVELYEWDGRTWRTHRFLHTPATEPVLAAAGSHVYIFDRTVTSSLMYDFDTETETFAVRQGPRYNERGYATRWFAHDGRIYTINSYRSSPRMMEIYDIAADTWTMTGVPYNYTTNAVFQPIVTDPASGEVYFCSMPWITKGFHFNPETRKFRTK